MIALTMGGQVPSVRMAATSSQMGGSLRQRQQIGIAMLLIQGLIQAEEILCCWPWNNQFLSIQGHFHYYHLRSVASSSDTLLDSISSLRNKPSRTIGPYSVSCLECYHILLRRWKFIMPQTMSRWAITGKQRWKWSNLHLTQERTQRANQALSHLERLWCVGPFSPLWATRMALWMLQCPPWVSWLSFLSPCIYIMIKWFSPF